MWCLWGGSCGVYACSSLGQPHTPYLPHHDDDGDDDESPPPPFEKDAALVLVGLLLVTTARVSWVRWGSWWWGWSARWPPHRFFHTRGTTAAAVQKRRSRQHHHREKHQQKHKLMHKRGRDERGALQRGVECPPGGVRGTGEKKKKNRYYYDLLHSVAAMAVVSRGSLLVPPRLWLQGLHPENTVA